MKIQILTPHKLELSVEIHAEESSGHVTKVTVGGIDITSACIAQPSAWSEIQDAAFDGAQEALDQVEREAAEARAWRYA